MPLQDIMKIVTGTISSVVKLFDDFYKQGYFLYLIIGLFMLVFAIMFWS